MGVIVPNRARSPRSRLRDNVVRVRLKRNIRVSSVTLLAGRRGSELRQAGVTESVIFPDVDGLGRELPMIWEERR
jgi:hypothetical protein